MLKYFITLFIISFCDTHPNYPNRVRGKYDQIILAQNSPMVSFFHEHKEWPNEKTSIPQTDLDEEGSMALFKNKSWVIHGLWPHKVKGSSPQYCTSGRGERVMKYRSDKMDPILKDLLKTTWPDLTANGQTKSIWKTEWTKHGSCIKNSDIFNNIKKYFDVAVELLNEYNIGFILERSDIVPGRNYTLNSIVDSLTNSLSKRLYVKCLPNESIEPYEQYLLEVQICFNKTLHLEDCYRSGTYACKLNRMVTYPKMKEDQKINQNN